MRTGILIFLLAVPWLLRAEECDTLVYGGTPAGIAAALAAASDGDRVLLVQAEAGRVGGLVTNGLSSTDFRTFESLTGAFQDFADRVLTRYREELGGAAEKACFRGTQAEPKVNLRVFEEMLAEQPRITLHRGWALDAVKRRTPDAAGMFALEEARFVDASGAPHAVSARVFIDATYEGDLLAASGEEYAVGREGREVHDEPRAPVSGDGQLQAYNFRLMMTKEAANRLPVQKPAGYDREEFAGVVPLLADGRIKAVFGYTPPHIFKAQTPPLPHGKWDINDVSHSLVRLSLPGENLAWPDGQAGARAFSRSALAEARRAIFAAHLRWNVGLLYFLQNDDAVPAKFREETSQWGWCKDEFVESGGLPEQLYVREARRMKGAYIFTEKDTDYAPDDARAVLRRDAIAICDYGPNCHGTGHEGPRFGGKHTGELYKPVAAYQIPYGVLVPRRATNLLVPGAMSASHVGFCALRFEPAWMSLGQAAGHAAHQSHSAGLPVQRVSVPALQARLHAAGAATLYVSDVARSSPDFAALQWWGTAGGLHGLAPPPAKLGERGALIVGQYFHAFPGHAAELEKPLDAALAGRWRALAGALGIAPDKLAAAGGQSTRGEFIRAAWSARKQR